MAKKNKRPNHARLVVPGEAPGKAAQRPRPAPAPKAETQSEERSRLDNTIDLTKDGALIRKKVARRRKRRHGLQVLLLVAVFLGVLLLYFSGIYRTAVLKGTDIVEGIRISLQGSGSFPLGFDIGGYRESDTLGSNGVVVLGERDVAIVSSTGRELYRFQHGYGNPHVTASDTRVCLYNRGGNELTIEGRDKRVTSRTTERDILFAEMSPNGALALATTSRFRASIEIYSNFADDEPQFSWEITDEKPYSAAFLSDNKHLALACVSTEGGALHTNIYLLHAKRDAVQASINAGAATVLDIQYLSQNRLLVVYDSYAATYNGDGEETARYTYAGGDIAALNSRDGVTALVFSSVSNNRVDGVLLDADLAVTGSFAFETAESPRVLVGKDTVYLLAGYDVAAYDAQGTLLGAHTLAYKGYDLAWTGEALVVTAGDIQSLAWLTGDAPEGEDAASGAGDGSTTPDEAASAEDASLPGDSGEAAGAGQGADGSGATGEPALDNNAENGGEPASDETGDESQPDSESPAADETGGDENTGGGAQSDNPAP